MLPLVDVRHLAKQFTRRQGFLARPGVVRAVDDVSFSIGEGETFGLVGESGSGKTTTGRCILRLIEPTSGEVWFQGSNVLGLSREQMRLVRRQMQIVFQDPYSSLNPRMRVREIIEEPLVIHTIGDSDSRRARAEELYGLVGLDLATIDRYPHEFSGGQRQRIGIARALILEPDLIVCDEPVSALDVSIQAQVLNLLRDLQRDLGLTLLFIAHNMAVVEHISDRVAVMYLGRVVEQSERANVYSDPRHPYTQALMSAIPLPDPDARRQRIILRGDVPSPINVPSGCRFHTRCWLYEQLGHPDNCTTDDPELREFGGAAGHMAACHYAEKSREVLDASVKERVN
jgi:oligopeptide/dipeptide ABC transporter ATP-binding protein